MVGLQRVQPLQRGDAVRIIAPSGAFERERFDAGLAVVAAAGFEPRFDEGLFARQLYFAGSDERRQEELRRALDDREAKAIWVARGGYGSARLLPGTSTEAVRRANKWLIGFSDVSALHSLWGRAGLVSMHASNVTTLPQWTPAARDSLFGFLTGSHQAILPGETRRGSGVVRGPLLGGNLAVLASLAGTGFLPSWRGAILFLEDVGERPYRLDRMLTQLRQAGALEGVIGIAIGQLTDCEPPAGDKAGCSALEALEAALEGLRLPMLAGLPVGHEPQSEALPLGQLAELDLTGGTLRVGGMP